MLSVKEVAEQLGMSPACVYQLVASGLLPSHRFGLKSGRIRVCESDLATYRDANRNEKKRSELPTASHATKPHNGFKHLRLDD